ncbi:MAG: iron ABC transporter permease [Clostridiales bacterium]|nr:iron ABC transporter permease [Clostridiales bacterium]
MQKRTVRCMAAFLVLALLLFLLFMINIKGGTVDISFRECLAVLFRQNSGSTEATVVWEIRLPRAIAALILGGALSVSGFLLQTFFGNPIAGPYVLGISSGAKLIVALVMIFLLGRGIIISSAGMILAAFAGSMVAMGLVLAVSKKVSNMAILVVCGVMIGYICSAVTDFVVTFAEDSNIVNLHNWSLGSFSGTSWSNVRVMTVVIAVTLVLTFFLSKPISAYQVGEIYAKNLGVNIRFLRISLILLSSILSATVTAFAGPISFVGIAVPHLMKSLFHTAKPLILLPGCFLGGAVFCLFCDYLARTVFSPTELSISSVTAIFGAPVVIYMMIQGKKSHK